MKSRFLFIIFRGGSYSNIKHMRIQKINQRGQIDPLVIPLAVSVALIVGLAIFSLWSYTKYTTEKNTVDKQIDEAVQQSVAEQSDKLEQEFQDREKEPYKLFKADETVGSLSILYPKTWSAYIKQTSGSKPLDAYFHPDYVPDSRSVSYALRTSVESRSYSQVVTGYQPAIDTGVLSVSPVTVSGQSGLRLDGEIVSDKTGSLVVLPLRDKTIQVWSESPEHLQDFVNVVIPNLQYQP